MVAACRLLLSLALCYIAKTPTWFMQTQKKQLDLGQVQAEAFTIIFYISKSTFLSLFLLQNRASACICSMIAFIRSSLSCSCCQRFFLLLWLSALGGAAIMRWWWWFFFCFSAQCASLVHADVNISRVLVLVFLWQWKGKNNKPHSTET